MALVRGQEYWFITDTEFNALLRLSTANPDHDIFDDVYTAFIGNSVTVNNHTYYYASVSSLSLEDDELGELYEEDITLDLQLFLSMATLHLSAT